MENETRKKVRKVIIALSNEFGNDWSKIFVAIDTKKPFSEKYCREEDIMNPDIVTIIDKNYPDQFKTINKPPFLFWKEGNLSDIPNRENLILATPNNTLNIPVNNLVTIKIGKGGIFIINIAHKVKIWTKENKMETTLRAAAFCKKLLLDYPNDSNINTYKLFEDIHLNNINIDIFAKQTSRPSFNDKIIKDGIAIPVNSYSDLKKIGGK